MTRSTTIEPHRFLGPWHATSLVVGITIGTGIFLKSAVMAQAVGTPMLLLVAWAAAGLIALCGALCFAELGALLPQAGGEYVYLRAAFGQLPAFLYVISSFIVAGAAISAYGAAVAIFLADLVPLGGPWREWHTHWWGGTQVWPFGMRQVIAVAVIAAFGALNSLGVAIGARVQTALTAVKVGSVAAVALAVFTAGGHAAARPFGLAGAGAAAGLRGLGTAMFAALWAYSGWQYLPMAASEVKEPTRNLPRAIIGGTLLVLGLYLAINLAYVQALPINVIAGANSTLHPEAPSVAALTIATLLGSKASEVAAAIFLISCIGALNGTILTRARVAYAAARDGLFFGSFGQLSVGSRVPTFSIALTCAWAALLAATGTFDQLTDMAVLWYALTWTPVVLAVIVLRRKLPDAPRPYRLPGYPWVPLAFAVVMVSIAINACISNPLQSAATLLLVLAGLPLYLVFRRAAPAGGLSSRPPRAPKP